MLPLKALQALLKSRNLPHTVTTFAALELALLCPGANREGIVIRWVPLGTGTSMRRTTTRVYTGRRERRRALPAPDRHGDEPSGPKRRQQARDSSPGRWRASWEHGLPQRVRLLSHTAPDGPGGEGADVGAESRGRPTGAHAMPRGGRTLSGSSAIGTMSYLRGDEARLLAEGWRMRAFDKCPALS